MNAGARAAKGDTLLFLHEDTILPDGYGVAISRVLGSPGVVAGAFRLGIDGSRRALRWIERAANWRSLRLEMPYGDQGIFLRASTFHELGGFREMPIMEDFDLMVRLKTIGRIGIAHLSVRTSGRRWNRLGILRTTLINQIVIVAYLLGVPPARLARWHGGKPSDENWSTSASS